MVEVGLIPVYALWLAFAVLVWRLIEAEKRINEGLERLDGGLGTVAGAILEKLDNFSRFVPDVNLINQNPIESLVNAFLKLKGIDNPINTLPNSQRVRMVNSLKW